MARHTEPAVNNSLGTLLQGMLPRSHVRSENTQAIVGHSGLRPDILITAPGRSPVVALKPSSRSGTRSTWAMPTTSEPH